MEQQPRLPLWFLLANWALIIAAFTLGTWLGGRRAAVLPEPQRTALELVYREVLESHIEPPDEHELLERAISGMVDDLDPYSKYVPPQKVAMYEELSTGRYAGIGASIGVHGDAALVFFPFPGGPAARAGLLPGDRILAVDDVPLATPRQRANVFQLLRGPADSEVRLTIARGDEQRELTLQRGDVQKPCVKWAQWLDEDRGLAYLYLGDFHPTAQQQLLAALQGLQRDRPLRGLVLDLRFDGGGSLDACIAIARMFVPHGVIATQRKRDGEVVETYEAKAELCVYPDLPMVLLVNSGSASASEVLAGALQDHRRAAVVGERTHGKAYVNTLYTWKDRDFRLKLTTGTYRTPNGRNIERHHRVAGTSADNEQGGIPPDVEVLVDKEQRARIESTLEAIDPPAEYRAAFAAVAARYDVRVPAPPSPAEDAQLAAALETLRERVAAAVREPAEQR